MATCCGRNDVEGRNRRLQNEGKPLAGKSTLNRLELSAQDQNSKYKKIMPKMDCLESFFIENFVDNLPRQTKRVVLDLDTTDDLIHGLQEGRFHHGYYDNYCYCPLYVFCGGMPVVSKLRTADSEHVEDTVEIMGKVVTALRKRFGRSLKTLWRGDSGFSRVELIQFCREQEVDFLFGFGANKLLKRLVRGTMHEVQSMIEYNKSDKDKLYKELKYKPKTSGWKEEPKYRVVAKCEVNEQGTNTRFIMTSLTKNRIGARELYEDFYCARGDMENRIKELC
ncbi:MAG TPA: IS1380 family transposase [Verrucomicrobiales bacterium]|nr:IS1380 family transposase [Verrucomicrobiales bacterium]